MWPSSGFGGNGQFENKSNQKDGPFSTFGNNSNSNSSSQSFFPGQPNMMQFKEPNGENYQPELGLHNNRTFLQNQFVGTDAQVCFVEPKHHL
jgi:hypothetical protein